MTRHWVDSLRRARWRRENRVRCCSKTKRRNGGIGSDKARKARTCYFNYNRIWRSTWATRSPEETRQQWTIHLLLSHHIPALVVDWQWGNTFSAFSFISCSSVRSFYHITFYERYGKKAHHISLHSSTECNKSEVCLRALLLYDLGLSRDPEKVVFLLKEHRNQDWRNIVN